VQSTAKTIDQYIAELPEDRKIAISELRKVIRVNLPKGFSEEMNYGMIGYVVPHSLYPKGYHCDPTLPLPYMNIASQKNFIAVYHMGIYADTNLLNWFVKEYTHSSKAKLDMGKSCIRFKKIETIPYNLIGELAGKMTVADWIGKYESAFKK
jgi:uncharacterized protein YdhG (YjbR/CyaY superfamily)